MCEDQLKRGLPLFRGAATGLFMLILACGFRRLPSLLPWPDPGSHRHCRKREPYRSGCRNRLRSVTRAIQPHRHWYSCSTAVSVRSVVCPGTASLRLGIRWHDCPNRCTSWSAPGPWPPCYNSPVSAKQIYPELTIIDYSLKGPCPLRCILVLIYCLHTKVLQGPKLSAIP